jgi:3-hydroxyacyl-CoA dehydrogenase
VAAERPFAEALAYERATFLELRGSDQAAALRHVFFAERSAPRPAPLAGVKPLPMATIAVMGGAADLQAALREADVPGVVTDPDDAALARCDLVILGEASAEIARRCRSDAVLMVMGVAPLDLPIPARSVGLHLIGGEMEVLPNPETTPETVATVFALARALGKLPVQTGGGSIGQRLLTCFRAEATALQSQGFSVDATASGVAGALRDPETAARLTRALADEGRALLAEGIALSATDIDLIAIHGLGYPRSRGGPMFEHRDRST